MRQVFFKMRWFLWQNQTKLSQSETCNIKNAIFTKLDIQMHPISQFYVPIYDFSFLLVLYYLLLAAYFYLIVKYLNIILVTVTSLDFSSSDLMSRTCSLISKSSLLIATELYIFLNYFVNQF